MKPVSSTCFTIAALAILGGCTSPNTADEAPQTAVQQSKVTTVTSTDARSGTSASTSTISTDGRGTSVSTATRTGTGDGASSSSSTSESNGAFSTSEETENYEFDYSWPSAAGRDPALAKILHGKREKAHSEIRMQSAEARSDSVNNGFPFRPHFLQVNWEDIADMPQMLSVIATIASYSGGAHGNSGFDGLVWDRKNRRVIEVDDLFTSSQAMSAALARSYCPALNKVREERRGFSVNPNSGDSFDSCPKMSELTIVPASSQGKSFNHFVMLAGPYVAGSYAEGPYIVHIPINAAIMAALKPAYRQHFSIENYISQLE